MVKVYDENKEIVLDVEYNDRLDYWDGRNNTDGSTGHHLGFTRIETGDYAGSWVLIHGTQWQGEQDRAEIVSADRIVKEAIRTRNMQELEEYPELQELYESKYKDQKIVTSKTFSVRVNKTDDMEEIDKKIEDIREKILHFLS